MSFDINNFSPETRQAARDAEDALYDVLMEMVRVVDRDAESILWELSDYHTRWDESPVHTWVLMKVFTGLACATKGDKARCDAAWEASKAALHYTTGMRALESDTEECAREWFAGVAESLAEVRAHVACIPGARPLR